MSDWVITLSYDLDPSMDDMDRWEDQLAQFDAMVSRVPGRGIDVVVHAPGQMDLWKAGRKLAEAVSSVVRSEPVGVEIITEGELFRRSEQPSLPELMSAAEIADELGISRQRVHQLRTIDAFPAPLADLRGGAVWDASAIRNFADCWERKPGRPRRASGA